MRPFLGPSSRSRTLLVSTCPSIFLVSACPSVSSSPCHKARWTPTCSSSRSYCQTKPLASASGLNALRDRNKALKQKAQADAETCDQTIFSQSLRLPIRARFAPSPTGYLHLGSLRTALFNRLAAEASNGGAFILRLEDTDQKRLVHDAEDRIITDLKWAGLTWDEGPDCGGPYGPYKQSLRLDIYKRHVQTLLDRGHAYRCFCTPEQLERQKRELHEAAKSTAYPGTCRSVDAAESETRASRGDAHVVRLKGDAFGRPAFRDAIYGFFQKKEPEEDFVLFKSDGFPTYHLANVVDDHLMNITHVIRGEEWLISTPKHLALYQAFGWQPPTFAHLGLLVNPDGSKLSKRDASVDLSTYQAQRIFPMALLSWLANLGSSFTSSTTNQHPRTISDLAKALTFKFTRGGIKLNSAKLAHFNTKYRDALLCDPSPALSTQEEALLNDHLLQPTLQKIDLVTSGESEKRCLLPEIWRDALTPVPAIANQDIRARYLHDMFVDQRGSFPSVDSLLRQYPYLIWRVPEKLYRRSLSSFTPNQHVISALEDALDKPHLWHDQCQPVMEAIWTALDGQDIDKLVVYNTLRLIGAGANDVVSQSSSRMFMILGRDEWQRRTSTVRKILGGG